jgi:NTE family protein
MRSMSRFWIKRMSMLAMSCVLAACATPFDNHPSNVPITSSSVQAADTDRNIVDGNVIALSLSGGGMRAAAFGFGVLQALGEANGTQPDLFDDVTFLSSVSGGSLTAAYIALHGRAGLADFRKQALERNLESDLRVSLLSPVNIGRLFAGGLNDRSNLAALLDREIFRDATFADLWRNNKPDVWINATDLYNRTPFPFIPPVFQGLCSDLSQLKVSEAVAASMAVPLAFAPVVLKTYPEECLTILPDWVQTRARHSASVATDLTTATARAISRYRDPRRMRYVKLVDGGLTDNQGLASILIARGVSGNDYGPLREADAIRLRRMLFLIVDAGRPPAGDWALQPEGPPGIDVALAAADAAIDSATRFSTAAFRDMIEQWRADIVRFRCSLRDEQVRRYLPAHHEWRCSDVQFFVDVIGFEGLDPQRAERMATMPTRLTLSSEDVDIAIGAGRDALRASSALRQYVSARVASTVR